MLDKIDKLYQLIFDGFKFELYQSDNLKIFAPEKINDEYRAFAKKFIMENKDFIITTLNGNISLSNILHFILPDNSFPLSFAQERLWFIEQYEGGTNAYNIPIVFKLSSNIKLDILENSIRSIVERHEVLRTLIKQDAEGNGYQLVLDNQKNPLKITKIKVTDHLQLDQALNNMANYIYDLSHEFPIKVCLYEVKGSDSLVEIEYYLSILIHHIVFDGWSRDIFLEELQVYYNYYTEQSQKLSAELNLPNLNIQYKEFSLWQRSYLSGERLKKQLEYWKNKLIGYETLNLISDKPRPSQINYKGANISFEIDTEISINLREFAKELKVSLYSLLLAGYYLMLKVYSNQQDIVVGTPIANRHYNQIENLIGFFANSLALRIKIDSNALIKEFIQKVGNEVIEAQLHQDLPFEKLVEELKGNKDTSRHPIFQALFAVQHFGDKLHNKNKENSKNNLANLLQVYDTKTGLYNIAKLDISTYIDDSEVKLKGNVNYSVVLYTEKTIKGFIQTYIQILKQLAALFNSPQEQVKTRIKDLKYLNEEQYHQIIEIWNGTKKAYPKDKTIHALFEDQVKRTPNRIAVIYKETQLTYKELNERSNQVAHYLRNLGVGSDTLVTIIIERSLEMLVGILGILKAGGAYVPLDPNYSDERLQYILDDTQSPVILTDKTTEDRVPATFAQVICLDKEWNDIKEHSFENPTSNIFTTNLSYVIYTSGTTGNPKGVMIEHEGVTNLVLAQSKEFGLMSSKDIKNCLFYSNYVFDAHVSEVYTSLLNGHTLHIVDNDIRQDIHLLSAYIENNAIDIATIPPVLLNDSVLLKLGTLVVAGDKTNKKILDFYQSNNVKIINAYGPTESTVCATLNHYNDNGATNIGKPISNISCYVLDNDLIPIPIGAVGELYIGGVGLARGYLNCPELTAEKFIINPFYIENKQGLSNKHVRLYKTGDLVRWLSDGNLEYIGRNDFQIKIRGYRIELGEIENTLSSYSGVTQSVVITRERLDINGTSDGTKYLVGYYVSDLNLDETEILNYLSNKLPDYMVPSKLVQLKDLPITINGKLDRRALPEPEFFNDKNSYIAPRNELEFKACEIWAEVLSLSKDKISIYDDFFRLGGDSILAIRLVSKLNQKFNAQVKVKDIFELKNLAKLAEMIASSTNKGELKSLYEPFSLVNIEDYRSIISDFNLIEDIYPASYLQMGMLLESGLNNGTYHNVSGFSIKAKYDQTKLLSIWEKLINKHELLRAKFILNNTNGWSIIIYKNIELDYQVYVNQNTVELIKNEYLNKFTYTKLGLCKLIINDYEDNFDLIFSLPHAIEDGWSMAYLINELVQAYINDKPIKTKLNLSYGEFIKNELTAIKDQFKISFWKNYLKDLNVTKVNWKFDTISPMNGLYTKFFNLDNKQVKLAHEMAKKLEISIDSIFLLAYFETLTFFTNNSDITIGLVVNNRLEEEGGDELFGLFLNTVPFRFSLNKKENYSNNLLNLFNSKLELQEYKQLPYGYIKSLFKQELYDFAFNFVHLHIIEDSLNQINYFEEKSRTNIPFMLDISQHGNFAFTLSMNVQANYISKDFLDYFFLYYQECLIKILQGSNQKLCLTQENYAEIICNWNQTDKLYTQNKTIQGLFEEQVEQTPNNIAIVHENIKLTYKGLNERANQLAHYIEQQCGVSPDSLIVIFLDKNENLLIAILAVLKAGGAYVPIDPSYPDERVKYILQDTETKLVLTNKKYQKRLDNISKNSLKDLVESSDIELTPIKVSAIDSKVLQKKLSLKPIINLYTETTSAHLAYVIYTSGTTGTPKGVMIEHKSYVATIDSIKNLYFVDKQEINTYSMTNYVFDIFGLEYGLPLLSGGTISIGNNEFYFLDCSNYHFIQMTPALCELKLDCFKNTENTKFFIGGERLSYELLTKIKEKSINFVNLYGPTETTIWSTSKWYACEDNKGLPYVTLGRPLDNERVYVLNSTLGPLPVGTIGELYIGGIGLARGYLNHPELTAEKFVDNPFQTQEEKVLGKNASLYKTGDLVRWLPCGELEYIGRSDFQIKIRGYRIELGEIESSLCSYEGITQSLVLAKEYSSSNTMEDGINDVRTNNNKYLIGYYVSKAPLDEASILEHLKSKLPVYMIPSILVHLDKLPLTINGKLDRGRLPEPKFKDENRCIIAPRNEIESQICKILAEMLGITETEIGIRDDFFRLGGNSILAIKLVSKLRQTLQLNVTIGDIFSFKNIEKLYDNVISLNKFRIKDSYQPIVKLNNSYNHPNMFMIHTMRGGSEVYISLASKLVNNFSCYGVDSYNLYNEKKICNLKELASYYLSYIDEIMIKTNQETYHLLGWSLGGILSLEIACLLEQRGNTKIKIYALDPILSDHEISALRSEKDINKYKNKYRNYFTSQGYDKYYIEKTILNMDIASDLCSQQLSSHLSNTQVLLFKAMHEDSRFLEPDLSKRFYQYIATLDHNNIDKIHNNKSNIKLVRMENVHHGSMLEEENILFSEIVHGN